MSNDQLAYIRDLIKQKRFDDARQQLIPLSKSGHPLAQKWLAKLDEIAPTPQQPATREARIGDYLDSVQQHKIQQKQVAVVEKKQERRFGCLVRSVFLLIFGTIVLFVLAPMIFAAGIVSNNPQLTSITTGVSSFIEEQQGNPIGRTMTRIYSETSGRLTETVVTSNMDRICDMVIEQVAEYGRTVERSLCEQIVNEVSVCMSDELVQAKQCLRRYVYNRCLQQVGNSPQGLAYCNDLVVGQFGPE